MTQLLMSFGQFIDHDITLALPSSSKAAYTTGNVVINKTLLNCGQIWDEDPVMAKKRNRGSVLEQRDNFIIILKKYF